MTNDVAASCVEYGDSAVRTLCRAAGLGELESEVVRGYRILSESWGRRRIDEPPLWSSLTADSTPLELSVVLADEPVAIRATVEAQAVPASPATYWAGAQRLTTRLAEVYDLDSVRLRRIEHLFAPRPAQRKPMVAFHTMGWSRHRGPEGKIYLWAGGTDRSSSAAICDEALSLLGFPGQWRRIADAMHPDDMVSYLCLDLGSDPSTRTKLYVQHRGQLTAERLESLDRLGPNPRSGAGPTMAELANRAAGRSAWAAGVPARTRFEWRSNSRRYWSSGTYFSLVHGRTSPIDSVMHQFALPPRSRTDAEARLMIHEVMDAYEVSERSRAAYQRCAEAFVGPAPAEQRYAHTYVSAQHGGNGTPPRVAVYFNPRMYYARYGLTNGDLNQERLFHGQ